MKIYYGNTNLKTRLKVSILQCLTDIAQQYIFDPGDYFLIFKQDMDLRQTSDSAWQWFITGKNCGDLVWNTGSDIWGSSRNHRNSIPWLIYDLFSVRGVVTWGQLELFRAEWHPELIGGYLRKALHAIQWMHGQKATWIQTDRQTTHTHTDTQTCRSIFWKVPITQSSIQQGHFMLLTFLSISSSFHHPLTTLSQTTALHTWALASWI